MAPKGLKKGDRFVDGGLTYEVLEVREDGYISKMVDVKAVGEPVKTTRRKSSK